MKIKPTVIFISVKWKSWMMLAGKDTAKSFLRNREIVSIINKIVIARIPMYRETKQSFSFIKIMRSLLPTFVGIVMTEELLIKFNLKKSFAKKRLIFRFCDNCNFICISKVKSKINLIPNFDIPFKSHYHNMHSARFKFYR